jgi:small-conductance mechanosensitive channel
MGHSARMAHALPHWSAELVSVALILGVALLVLRLLERLVKRWAAVPVEQTADLLRQRRRETAIGVLSSAVRYFVAALTVFVLLGFLLRNMVTAAAGATLVIAIIAFGAQRFLQDVISGFFILLEN